MAASSVTRQEAATRALAFLSCVFQPDEPGGKTRTTLAGYRVEALVFKRLKALLPGVTRSAGSRGIFDVTVINADCRFVLGCQIKHSNSVTKRDKWVSPIEAFGDFVPVLIERFPGGWRITVG